MNHPRPKPGWADILRYRARTVLAAGSLAVALTTSLWSAPEGAAVPAHAASTWSTTQLTFTNGDEAACQIDGEWLLWEGHDGSDWELYLYHLPAGPTVPLTNNPWDDVQASLRGDWITWVRYDPDPEIILYQISTDTRTQITSNSTDDVTPDVYDGWVVWSRLGTSEYEIFVRGPGMMEKAISNTPYGDHRPRIEGDYVVWEYADGPNGDPTKDGEIYLHYLPTGVTSPLTVNGTDDSDVSINGGRVVWQGYDGADTDIFILDLTAGPLAIPMQLTTDSWDDFSPRVAGNWVAWEGRDASGDAEIYVRDLTAGTQGPITNNAYDEWFGALGGDLVAWSPPDGNDFEVYVHDLVENATTRLTDNVYDDGFLPMLGGWGLDAGGSWVTWVGFDGNDTEVFLAERSMPVFAFVDVPSMHPYAEPIEDLAQWGIINGYEVSPGVFEFRPDNPVWRAQFAKMICGARHIPVDETMIAPFGDLGADDPGDLYPHEYVAAAYAAGITKGTTTATFSPWGEITRAQVVTMVVRALEGHPGLPLPPPGYVGTLGDFDPVHGPTMRHAEYLGLLNGLEGFGPGWDPWAPATRGEVARILWVMILD